MSKSEVCKTWDSIWQKNTSFAPVNSEHDTISVLTRLLGGKIIDEATILDVGSGPGSRTIPILGIKQNVKLILLDQSIDALGIAQRFCTDTNVRANHILADAFQLPFPDDSVECVFANGLNEHFLDPYRQNLFEEMTRITRPGGLMAIVVPNKLNPFHTANKVVAEKIGTWQFGSQFDFTPFELRDRVKKTGLKDVEMYGVGAYTSYIRMFPKTTQQFLHMSPTPFVWLNNILWRLDADESSFINRTFGREIMAIGKK